MEKIYLKYKGKKINQGILCGYTQSHFILAVITDNADKFFRKFDDKSDVFIEEEYKDSKYRYVYCNESDLTKVI